MMRPLESAIHYNGEPLQIGRNLGKDKTRVVWEPEDKTLLS